MADRGHCYFETTLGPCGIAWNERGIARVLLPEATVAETRAQLSRRLPGSRECAPPVEVQRAIDAMVALLRGDAADLSGIALDMRGVPSFERRVYELARGIAPGRTLTYGDIAARLGDPQCARAVGQALGRNPFPIVVPCHRVLAAGGKPGGFSAPGGATTKLRMLAIEGAPVTPSLF